MEEKVFGKYGFKRFSDSILYTEAFSKKRAYVLLNEMGYQHVHTDNPDEHLFIKRIKRKYGRLTDTISLYATYGAIICTNSGVVVFVAPNSTDSQKSLQKAITLVSAKIEKDKAEQEQTRWTNFRWHLAFKSKETAEGNFMLVDASEAYRIMKSLGKEPEDFIFAKEVNGKRVEYPQIFMLSKEYATEGEVARG